MPADGAVFLNGDDAYSIPLSSIAAAPVTLLRARGFVRRARRERRAGRREPCLLRPGDAARDGRCRRCRYPGRHNVYNALAAAAVALRLAVSLDRVAEGLGSASTQAMRMESFTAASGVLVINDAYNANPSSMGAAIETLSEVKVTGKRIAVLGDMAELGSLTELAHFRIGEQVAQLPIDVLVTVGREGAPHRRWCAGQRAWTPTTVRPCESVAEAVEVLDDLLAAGDVVLVKASRVMGLEAVVEGIVTPRAG